MILKVASHNRFFLVVLILALPTCGMDGCRSNPVEGELIRLGKVIRTLGDEGDPVRLAVMEYRQGSAKGQIWLATVETSRVRLTLHSAREGAQPLKKLLGPARVGGDYVAINGGFYDEKGALGLVVSEGKQRKALRRDGGSGVFMMAGGVPDIVHRDDYLPPPDIQLAVQSIDRLVADGSVLVKKRPELPFDARSAVAIDGLGTVYFLVIFDDRSIASSDDYHISLNRDCTETGTTLYALAEFLARPFSQGGLEVKHALNLDGGFSTSMQARIGGRETGVIAYKDTINALLATPE